MLRPQTFSKHVLMLVPEKQARCARYMLRIPGAI